MNEKQLPKFLEEISRPGRKQMTHFFQYVHRWRVWLFHHWSKGINDKEVHLLPEAVDQLIGLILLLIHCRTSYGINASVEKALKTEQVRTYCDLLAAIRREMTCPILKKVFSLDKASDLSVNVSLFSSRIESRLEAAILLLLQRKNIPLWLFGDYHQLCVATPPDQKYIQRSSNERYSRGIHYTPAPLVDYLSTSAIDGFVQGDSTTTCRILDPSCGCGAFLIASFRYLVQHMPNHVACRNNALDILQNCIYGTDIDHRAVTWTQKLLYLAAKQWIDSETPESFDEKIVVPDLHDNIKCCNFLADGVTKAKPFDIILGGPPFVPFSELKRTMPNFVSEARRQFRVAQKGQFDLYMIFIEKALSLLRPQGQLGFSLSNTFLRSKSGELLRKLIRKSSHVDEIIEFSDKRIYPDAAVQIALLRLTHGLDLREPTRHIIVNPDVNIRVVLNEIYLKNHISTSLTRTNFYEVEDREWSPPVPSIANIARDNISLGDLPLNFFKG